MIRFTAFILTLAAGSVLTAWAQEPPDAKVETREVVIWSDGTRMRGDLYLPKERDTAAKFPAVIYCSGTAGTRPGAARFSMLCAAQGFAVLAFDYRGWGSSDSKLMALEPQPKPDEKGEMTIRVRALRWQMNYADQTEDIRAAISFMAKEPAVNPGRIGLFGTSYGGGLVTWVAGNDPRVKCVVAQVPGMGGGRPADAYRLLEEQAHGEAEPVPYETGKFSGKMARYDQMRVNSARSIGFSTFEAAEKISAPMLIVDGEKEDLFDIKKNGGRVAEILEGRKIPVKYQVVPGMDHYGVYRDFFADVTKIELEWYAVHLKK
ncbi:MAG TPA: alpha/beta fold hydrolase [Planctomycetota bacterium]|nr:alpha/beta fold hydrolase [Planctomycetota bacterium]